MFISCSCLGQASPVARGRPDAEAAAARVRAAVRETAGARADGGSGARTKGSNRTQCSTGPTTPTPAVAVGVTCHPPSWEQPQAAANRKHARHVIARAWPLALPCLSLVVVACRTWHWLGRFWTLDLGTGGSATRHLGSDECAAKIPLWSRNAPVWSRSTPHPFSKYQYQ